MLSSSDRRVARLALLFASAAAASLGWASAAAAAAAAGAATEPAALEEVVVTARRSEEGLQKVPVAVSVVTPAAIAAKGQFQPQDLSSLATGLSVVASIGDRSNVTYSIRGQNQAFGTLFPAVITYFNEVPITHLATGNFYDLANVQVLRGPQGVLFGRVTDGGNVMLTPKHPTNAFEGNVEVKVGDYGLKDLGGALNVPIVADKVLLRGAFEIDRRHGFTRNDFNGQRLDNVASDAFRVGLTLRPTDWLENYSVFSYQHVHNNGTATVLADINPAALTATISGVLPLFTGAYGIDSIGRVVPFTAGTTLLTPANYLATLQNQLAQQKARGPRDIFQSEPSFDSQKNVYAVNATTVDLGHDLVLKNIVGYTRSRDSEASNFSGDNSGLVATCHSGCAALAGNGSDIPFTTQQQYSEEIRLAGKFLAGKLTWSLGGYADEQKPDGAYQNDTVNVAILHRTNVQYSKSWSKAAFGYAEYDASDFVPGLKVDGGYRYTKDKVKSSTVTYIAPIAAPGAQAALATILQLGLGLPAPTAAFVSNATVNFPIPFGQCVTVQTASLFGPFTCRSYTESSIARTWNIGASYALPTGQLFYVKYSRGYRPGGVNGSSPPDLLPVYEPEYDKSLEAGIKADWNWNGVLARTNIAVFRDRYTNIQKGVVLPGPVPLQVVRNVAAATIKGVEFEGTLKPVADLTLGLNYAYTDAGFKHVNTAGPQDPCNPANASIVGFCTDNRLAFTPKHQVSVTVDYRLPLDDSIGRISVGGLYHYQSSIALTDTSALNPAAIEKGYATLDLNATWANAYGSPVDITVFATNVTDKLYRTGNDDLTQRSSLGIRANIFAPPRMFGIGLKYRFGGAS
ncbi:MAG: TonB-dependent receptor [Caulobacterales bacterium]|nr:TonB-dependent receptor [Caulobacterales bacterium]